MGPLQGLSVVEIAGAGPAPFCAMVLADLGADVVRVDRAAKREVLGVTAAQLSCRGKRSIAVDLKSPEGVAIVLRLAARADALIEGFRPGVAERLGIGPEDCWASNPRLVYARGTGYGQDGPLAARAGHDIDYVAVAGALHPIGRPGERPVPPLNLVADFGGGGMLLVVGVLAGIFEAARSGRGQVVDAAMVDGVALLTTVLHEMRSRGLWVDERGANLVDGGAPFYDTYETSDGRYVAVGAMEPQFFAELVSLLGLDADELPDQLDRGAGRCCEPGSPRRSGGGLATSGPSSPLTLTLASFPCSSSVRRRRIRSIASARRSPMSAARSSRHPPRGSAGPRPPVHGRHRNVAPTRMGCCAMPGTRPTRSPCSAAPGPSSEGPRPLTRQRLPGTKSVIEDSRAPERQAWWTKS